MFRFLIVGVLLVTAVSAADAQQQKKSKMRFSFDATSRAQSIDRSEVGNLIARRTALRSWTDSVDVFIDQALMAYEGDGLERAQDGERANLLVSIVALPVMDEKEAIGMTVYSLIVFKPNGELFATTDWKYTTATVGYSTDPQMAAESIVKTAVDAMTK